MARRRATAYLLFLDCDTPEAANVFVIAFDFALCRAFEAFASIAFPVNLVFPVCDSALPAKLRWRADEEELRKVFPALEATLVPVDLLAIPFPFKVR